MKLISEHSGLVNRKARDDIELLRIICSFGIVYFHSQVAFGHLFSYSSLILFVGLSAYLGGKGSGLMESLIKRAKRLLVPWAFWFVVYALVNYKNHRIIIDAQNGYLAGVLAGPSIHLWYLPFIFICLLFIDLARLALSEVTISVVSWVISVSLFLTADFWYAAIVNEGEPWGQYGNAIPCVFAGLYLSKCSSIKYCHNKLMSFALVFASLVAGNGVSAGVAYPVGIAALVCIQRGYLSGLKFPPVHFLSKYTFGIYLVHVLMLRLAAKITSGLCLPLVAFALSFVVVFVFARFFPKISRRVT